MLFDSVFIKIIVCFQRAHQGITRTNSNDRMTAVMPSFFPGLFDCTFNESHVVYTLLIASVHDTWLDRSSSEDEQEDRRGPGLLSARSAFTPIRARDRSLGQTPQRSSRCSLQEGGTGLELEADSSSMWLGTEDGW